MGNSCLQVGQGKQLSSGALLSMTNMASSLAENMAALSFDEEHERVALSRMDARGVGEGLLLGCSDLGISLLGAVGGLVHHPLQSVISGGSFVGGVGKGVVGAVTKPVGGAARLLAHTGRGILATTGWTHLPQPLYSVSPSPALVLNPSPDLAVLALRSLSAGSLDLAEGESIHRFPNLPPFSYQPFGESFLSDRLTRDILLALFILDGDLQLVSPLVGFFPLPLLSLVNGNEDSPNSDPYLIRMELLQSRFRLPEEGTLKKKTFVGTLLTQLAVFSIATYSAADLGRISVLPQILLRNVSPCVHLGSPDISSGHRSVETAKFLTRSTMIDLAFT
ncbi:unnamed protein product [Cyprideis torosa]|uniref:Uncharacterized protein n=1 Tax=Cyprideis torosa TaxID=163714 RepID=A0A7R8WNM2_9CRUS|nr:unnamed protein product [Cyprideis torosa]CAG0900384.1 unnamed protein product [Cyprideis torosa]